MLTQNSIQSHINVPNAPIHIHYARWRHRVGGYRTFRPGSVSARKNMDVSAKSMDDSAKNDERFGQKRWTFRPNIYLIVFQRQMTHTIENSHLDILHVVCYDDSIKQSCRRQASILQRNVGSNISILAESSISICLPISRQNKPSVRSQIYRSFDYGDNSL